MAGYVFAVACATLLCACYGAGRAALPPWWTAGVAAGAGFVPATQFAIRPSGLAAVPGVVSAYLVFAALPLLAGRYVAAQRQAAEQARLRERREIAREMHDSLGRQLSLAAVQAAALEVGDLPAPQHAAITRLATAIRASVTELHEIVGAARSTRGMPEAGRLIGEFRAAGVAVSASSRGAPRPLSPQASQAAYRVIEEGLTNATRHAAGRPVTVTIAWEAAALLVTVLNPTVLNPAAGPGCAPGSGLADLAGRLRQAGGHLDHEVADGQFRLRAVLPFPAGPRPKRAAPTPLGLAVGLLLLVVLPAVVLVGLS